MSFEGVVDWIAALMQGVAAVLIAMMMFIGAFYLAAKAWSTVSGFFQ